MRITRSSSNKEGRPESSSAAGPDVELDSPQIFDLIAQVLASGMPRRKALAVALKGVAGAALAEVGIRSAWAAPTCLCQGQIYDPVSQCCTATGVQAKNPITNLAACPGRVARPGYTAVANGCGAAGSSLSPYIPNGFGAANFTPCCDTHDVCYGTCNNVKVPCDTNFGFCLGARCDAAYPVGSGVLNDIRRNSCRAAAGTYESAVTNLGGDEYTAAQQGACDCCSTSTCPQSCVGGTCANLPPCGGDPGCVCFQTVEGTGFCHRGQPCAGLSACSSSATCPAGWACVSVTCCGSQSICIRPCTVIGPAGARSARGEGGQRDALILTTTGYRTQQEG